LGKEPKSWGYEYNKNVAITLKDDCMRMRTDLFLGHIHDHNDLCAIKDGIASGPFVYYKNSSADNAILVLGGSTTDGFYNHFSQGNVWPLYLNKLVASKKFFVINGGVGGYGSSKELLKLLIDGGRINANIKYVISLNGINDMPGYRSTGPGYWLMSREDERLLPFWTWVQYQMFSTEVFLKQNTVSSASSDQKKAIAFIAKVYE
jgi:hypothetical protein